MTLLPQKHSYTHDGMIDLILANPSITRLELAQAIGYSPTWVSILVNSDAFKERLAQRKVEVLDPVLRTALEERIKGAANRALDKLIERLDNPGTVISTKDLVSIARLNGAPAPQPVQTNVQNNFVMNMPAQAPNSRSWLENRMGGLSSPAPAQFTGRAIAAENPLLDSDAPSPIAELVENRA